MDDKNLSQWIQIKFSVVPKDLSKYRMAITTRQYEVLEFFGDSVLGFVVSEYLVQRFTIDRPGWFTEVKSKLVEDKNLSLIARGLNLGAIVTIPNTSSKEQITDRVVADILEALIGAIYLDQGLDKCREVIYRLFKLNEITPPFIYKNRNLEASILNVENPISTLQELLAKYGISPPEYLEVGRSGVDHSPTFTIRANCKFQGQYLTADGSGKSKQIAKNNAALKLLVLVLES
ncbi:ribonuclease III family protein [Nostoc sp. C117]|uniref:ribonuclease III family protein n=1 Tax=Nostoc sp. C117 TaxID=3349875 RepID=UPI00370D3A68